jgi:hypothetical protein
MRRHIGKGAWFVWGILSMILEESRVADARLVDQELGKVL